MAARPALQQKGKTALVIQKSQQKNRAGSLDMSFVSFIVIVCHRSDPDAHRAAHCTRMGMPVPLVHELVWDARD